MFKITARCRTARICSSGSWAFFARTAMMTQYARPATPSNVRAAPIQIIHAISSSLSRWSRRTHRRSRLGLHACLWAKVQRMRTVRVLTSTERWHEIGYRQPEGHGGSSLGLQRKVSLEQELIHVSVGICRIARPTRSARANHKSALNAGTIGTDRVDLTGVHARDSFRLGPQLATCLAEGQRHSGGVGHGTRCQG